ncbi:MAG: glutamate--cysteine ligase [Myxococcaceae bacterium]
MSLDVSNALAAPLTSTSQLVDTFRTAEKPVEAHRLGLEHEKLLYAVGSAEAVTYEGPRGIGAVLEALAGEEGEAFREAPDRPVIALRSGDRTVTLEPGGQFEHAGSPFRTAREADAENRQHLGRLKHAAAKLGLRVVMLGYRPAGRTSDVGWMPKSRYQAMRETLGTRGPLALHMMLMTATSQVSLDFSSEADCARKMTVASRTAPLLVALFANSTIVEGQPSAYKSYRSHVWTGVDSARCGFFATMLDGSFSYAKYVAWALEAPVLFLRRGGRYLTPRMTFGDLMTQGWEGKPLTEDDWLDHLSTLFPEVRLKRVLEIRSADSGSAEMTGALGALMRGQLYDAMALGEVETLLPVPSLAQQQEFMAIARRDGLNGVYAGRRLQAWAKEWLDMVERGLRRIDVADVPLLAPLRARVESGCSPADDTLALWKASPSVETVLANATL